MKGFLFYFILLFLILLCGGGCTSHQPSPIKTLPAEILLSSTTIENEIVSTSVDTATEVELTPAPVPMTPEATLPACTGAGKILQHSLPSEKLRQPMDYRVYLPPCYDAYPDKRYPVLYLIHGQSYTDDQWDRLGADEVAEQLILSGEVTPFLIVMPRDRLWEQPKDDPFGEVLIHELLPTIDRSYRTIPQRSYRAIGGLSRGAGWAVHLGLRYWYLFDAIGAHSLAVFESDAPKIEGWLDAIPSTSLPRIFLDIGDRDRPPILQSAIWFEQLLTRKRISHEWYLYSGYHEEAYWQAHVEQYIRWYAAPWSEDEFDIIEP